ncbi:efflux RND transporter periplasmic adaptor subunit [Actimicrobium antarcticum]|uniref:Efflux RND transporter periplasmic adaptor subunit n=1 Tax=Actimicrobium antarcticum TaxID=1051899 RepID=A0ABP7TRX7_9BURK
MTTRRNLLIMAMIAVAVAAGTSLYLLGKHQSMAPPAPVAATTAEKKVLYWHDPMVPGQRFDKPGPSPFMDMALVPVYADAGSDDGQIVISPRMQQNLGVRTAEVTSGTLPSGFSAVGNVAYNERDVVLVQARAAGFVERLYVRAVLDPVRQGQALAELYVPDWVAAQEEFLTVRRMTGANTDVLVDGARQRMRLAGMNAAQIRQVESTGKVQARVTIQAPRSGVLTELSVREGSTVMAGAPLMRLNGTGTVWINAEIAESQAAQVRPGMTVEARTAALPAVVFKGTVSALLPQVTQATRTLIARIELANPSGQLAPGMFVTLQFAATTTAPVLLVASEAVIRTGTRTVVMVAQGDGKFAPVDIEAGTESNGQTVVLKGLAAGQKVVTSGQFLIDSDASLKGVGARMAAP